MRSPILIYPTWPWSKDRREFGSPIAFHIHTRALFILIRPFCKAQAYDWKRGCWTGVIDAERMRAVGYEHSNFDANAMVWRHVAVSPQKPQIWEALHGH